jgi:molybdate transport system substrate-binding protein
MRQNGWVCKWLCAALIGSSPSAFADTLRVAVASNFQPAMKELAVAFQNRSGHQLTASYGSTGKHYAQIVNGAPFDLFLAADAERPRRLELEGFAVAGSRFTYAVGKLVLWSPVEGLIQDGHKTLIDGQFRFLAIANPRIAPYGRAAKQVLRGLGLWEAMQPRMVRGENIAQAFAFVKSGNAELGFIAWSQLPPPLAGGGGSVWMVPQELYQPIEQQGVLLKDGPVARAFLEFVRSEQAAALIMAHGYERP